MEPPGAGSRLALTYRIDYGDGRSYTSYSTSDAKTNAFWHRYWNPAPFGFGRQSSMAKGNRIPLPAHGPGLPIGPAEVRPTTTRAAAIAQVLSAGRLDFVGNRIWSMLLARRCRLLARLEQWPKRSSEHHDRTCIWIDPTQVPPNLATSAQPMK